MPVLIQHFSDIKTFLTAFPKKKKRPGNILRGVKHCQNDRCRLLLLLLDFGEAFTAVYRAVFPWLERNLAWFAACRTYGIEHFTLRPPRVFTSIAALFASLRLIYKALLCIKFLLASCENKFLTTFFADKFLVLVHAFYLALRFDLPTDGIEPTPLKKQRSPVELQGHKHIIVLIIPICALHAEGNYLPFLCRHTIYLLWIYMKIHLCKVRGLCVQTVWNRT